jgi:cyclopropane-fatty-acyl-phospholipid synthase
MSSSKIKAERQRLLSALRRVAVKSDRHSDSASRVDSHIDANRWPDVAKLPRSIARRYLAEIVFSRAVSDLPLRVSIDGQLIGGGDLDSAVMIIHRPKSFFRRLGADGLIGFGESYMAGDWEADDLVGVISAFATKVDSLVPRWLQRMRRYYVSKPPQDQRNTVEGAARNVHQHYDLPTRFFELFLDETMTYSSGIFLDDELSHSPDRDPCKCIYSDASLSAAQRRKLDRLLNMTNVGAGTRLLELGTGWGSLAILAGKRGARVESLTISDEQYHFAVRRVEEELLADTVTIRLQDYRQAAGQYDVILSIEMIEAVGEQFWPTYFRTIDRLLAPGGVVGIQAITMPHDRMLATRNTYTWMHKYIFPGGLIPSVASISTDVAKNSRLCIVDDYAFGESYARTIHLWRKRFETHVSALNDMGMDEVFRRMWTFYLSYVEAGFQVNYLDVHQLILSGKME